MKNRMNQGRPAFTALALATALLLTPLAARGDDHGTIPRFAVVLDSGAVFVKEAGFGSGARYGGGIFLKTGHRMGVELLLERFAVPVELGAADLVSAGRMTETSLLINEQLYVLTEGRVLPFALLGVGFTFLGYAPDNWPLGTPRRAFVDRMALQIGAGLDVRVSSALALCGKARYNLVKTWMEDEGRTDPIRDTDPLAQNMLHLYGLELGLGIKLSF
jgi:hypothetical protein